jgi:hypothetical protein
MIAAQSDANIAATLKLREKTSIERKSDIGHG